MNEIRHTATLFYYDGAQVFEARDSVGGRYVAVMIEPTDERNRYLVAEVSPEKLQEFRCGALDLRTLLVGRGKMDWFICFVDALDEPIELLDRQSAPLAASGLLPEPGFLFEDEISGAGTRSTTERAFEANVEQMLVDMGGWQSLDRAIWDKANALFPSQIFAFLADTQPKLWEQMQSLHDDGLESMLITALVKELDLKGTLHILRHGFKFYGKTFRLAYFKPAHGLNYEILDLYSKNRLTVSRQIPCHPNTNDEMDLTFAVNGLPVATCELKNPGTGQTWRHAVKQYQDDRDPNAPLFQFKKRALVHFAADPDEIHMTTRLAGDHTFFLPFNRGSDPGSIACGSGNPQHPSGYRTGYFWEDVLQFDSFLDILGHFMFVEKRDEKVDDGKGGKRRVTTEKLIFPRYHQLDSVRKLVRNARSDGTGHNYLIQHSAGSGKTNSISWLAHRLASLHDADHAKIYDCVIVITDRRVLDKQLQDAIYQIEHAQGVVKAVDQDSKQLANALIDGTKIVVTTLQKFPFVLRGLLSAAGATTREKATDDEKTRAAEWEKTIAARSYAVIVDEAHSSQTGETARELKAILGAGQKTGTLDEDGPSADWEDGLNQVMLSRGRQPNLSFFAFTATPKGKTLELFGHPGPDGTPEAFHTYSMRQAIEESFILDVVRNYTTYRTFYRLVKAAEDDPELPKKKGARALAKFMSLHPHNIEQKTEVMVEHFRQHVRRQLGGRGKAMVVTSSRLHAVRYKLAFERHIEQHGYTDVRPLVAFSGKVKDPDTGFGGYVSVYAFLSQIIPWADETLEKLYSFGRHLLTYLPLDRGPLVKLGDEVALKYYRLERIFSGAINISEGEPAGEWQMLPWDLDLTFGPNALNTDTIVYQADRDFAAASHVFIGATPHHPPGSCRSMDRMPR